MPVDFAFLDSGTGGIPYLLHLEKKCPGAECVYLADTRNFPYGEKSSGEIIRSSVAAAGILVDRFSPAAVIVACNTISVTALDDIRRAFPEVRIVGTVPAIKLAADVSVNRRIGLLATNATVGNPYNMRLKDEFAPDCELVPRGDSELVSFVEHRAFTASEAECEQAVRPAVEFFRSRGCDTIILGCTHFLNLADTIRRVAGEGIRVVDSRDGVVRRALSVHPCVRDGILSRRNPRLFVTGFSDGKDEAEYGLICRRFSLDWGGILG